MKEKICENKSDDINSLDALHACATTTACLQFDKSNRIYEMKCIWNMKWLTIIDAYLCMVHDALSWPCDRRTGLESDGIALRTFDCLCRIQLAPSIHHIRRPLPYNRKSMDGNEIQHDRSCHIMLWYIVQTKNHIQYVATATRNEKRLSAMMSFKNKLRTKRMHARMK